MKPAREHATYNNLTYFVTSQTWGRKSFFQHERWARFFLEMLFHYRERGYFLHEFVVMPDHFHLLITPKISLERAIQFVKGGFSHKVKAEFKYPWEIWQKGFSDHRIRDAADYENHKDYIYLNPVRKKLASSPAAYPYYSSAAPGF